MKSRLAKVIALFFMIALLQGCGILFGGGNDAATPTPTRAYALVPTFTPTTVSETTVTGTTPTDTSAPSSTVAAPVEEPSPTPTAVGEVVLLATETATAEPVAQSSPTQPAANEAKLTVTGDIINIRAGPDTTFETIGTAAKDESFAILAKNSQGDWWQICCINGNQGWIFGQLATVANAESVAIAAEIPTPVQPTAVPDAPIAEAPAAEPTAAPPSAAPPFAAPLPVADNGSAGDFNPEASYQIVHFKVLGKDENNGGIRDSRAQHLIFVTVLDQNGNGVDGAVVENLVGDKSQVTMGSKGPGKAELTMYYDPFKLRVVSDPSGPVTSQVSNQMGLAFPHLPDIVGRLGGLDYEYAVCPTIDVKCSWPIQGVHYSYEITFQRVK